MYDIQQVTEKYLHIQQ